MRENRPIRFRSRPFRPRKRSITPGKEDILDRNLHENRPGSFVSSDLIFATYQNAGLRAYDISDPYRPTEVAAFVPPAPKRMMDRRPNRPQVIQSCDVFVDASGLIYTNDYNAGLFILERTG